MKDKDVWPLLKKEGGLSYRMTKAVGIHYNTEENMVVRQQYAFAILQQLLFGQRVINLDETTLPTLSFSRKQWLPKKGSNAVPTKNLSPKLTMIAAIETDGRVYAALSQAYTDSDTLFLFVYWLVKQLDAETPNWRSDTVFLLDGATYHKSEQTRKYFAQLKLDVVFTGPYSAPSSPVEQLFNGLKRGDLNPRDESTGAG